VTLSHSARLAKAGSRVTVERVTGGGDAIDITFSVITGNLDTVAEKQEPCDDAASKDD
jgi:hypothetical protein